MQEKQLLGLSLTALGVIGGVFGLFVTGVFDTESISATYAPTTGMVMGHAVIEARDSQGNLIAYRETDNEVVNNGENCVLKMLFDADGPTTKGTSVCTGAVTSAWNYIGIGTVTGSQKAAADSDGRLGNETSTVTGLSRAAGTVSWTNGSGNSTAASASISKTFTMTSGNTHTIAESGLFNGTSLGTSGMLARQTFTGVALSSGDSITVTWTFTVGD